MNRRNFLVQTSGLVCACGLAACQTGTEELPAPVPTTWRLDLRLPMYSGLRQVGGWLVVDNQVLVIAATQATWVALERYCTHAAGILDFVLSENLLRCRVHGSEFALDGSVLQGPAVNPLRRYRAGLEGDWLKIE